MKGLLIIPIAAITLAACSTAEDTTNTTKVTPVAQTQPQPSEEAMMEREELSNIVETAVESGDFNTLVTAVQAAGLVETLSGPGPFTVFAPTEEAFAAVPEATLNALLEDPEALAEVLTYHVVAGKVMAEDVMGLDSATTVQGSDVEIDASDGVMINGAKVIKTDIETSNGVIHVIDTVLLPPDNS